MPQKMCETPKNLLLRLQWVSRAALLRLTILAIILSILISWGWFAMIQMPGKSFQRSLPPLTPKEVALRNTLKQDLEKLAGDIGERNYLTYKSLTAAADFLKSSWATAGYQVQQ